MSTDRKRKTKHSFLYAERFRILEYGLIGALVLLFAAGAVLYGLKSREAEPVSDAPASPTPVPTADPSIRGMNVLAALEDANVTVALDGDDYALTAPNGVPLTMTMGSDDDGVRTLSIETYLSPEPDGESTVAQELRKQNAQTIEALRAVFDAVMPVFHRSIADSETIVKQCRSVVEKGESYAKRFGSYSARILSDIDHHPQSVVVTLVRDN